MMTDINKLVQENYENFDYLDEGLFKMVAGTTIGLLTLGQLSKLASKLDDNQKQELADKIKTEVTKTPSRAKELGKLIGIIYTTLIDK